MIAILATMTIVTAIDVLPEADALKKSKGVYNQKYGSATKGIVCGDQLCSDVGKTSSDVTKTKSAHTPMSTETVSIDSIQGAVVKNTGIDRQSGIVTVSINAQNDGKIMMSLPHFFQDAFMVIVDGEEWDDAHIDGSDVKVYFLVGTEKIEIIGKGLS